MIVKVTAKFRYADFIVLAVLSVKFDVSIVVEENDLIESNH